MSFKTQAEIYRALLDGKKIHNSTVGLSCDYIMMGDKGFLIDQNSKYIAPHFYDVCNWDIFEETKKKKQVWQWRCLKQGMWCLSDRLYTEEEALKWYQQILHEKHAGPWEVDE